MKAFGRARDAFLESLRLRNYSSATIQIRRESLDLFLGWLSQRGVTQLGQIGRETIRAYQLWLLQRQLSTRTLHVRLSSLQQFFAFMHSRGTAKVNPCEDMPLPKLEERLPRVVLTVAECRRIIEQPDTTTAVGIRDRAILEVFYATAMRRAELLALHIEDIDWRQQVVRVCRGKGLKERVVPLGESASRTLRQYITAVRSRWVAGQPEQRAVWLASRRPHLPISKELIVFLLHRYAHVAGIGRKVTAHAWRHSCATHLVGQGANLAVVQQLLGHSSIRTTQVYAHTSLAEIRQTHRAAHPRP